MAEKTKKQLVKEVKKAAESGKVEKLAAAVGCLLQAGPPKPAKKAAKGTGAKVPKDEASDQDVRDSLEAVRNYGRTYQQRADALGGGAIWGPLVPVLIDLAQKLLESWLNSQQGGAAGK